MSGQSVEYGGCDQNAAAMHDEGTAEFLNRIQQNGIRLSADGDRLACSAPKGALTAEVKAELVRRKPEILRLLLSANAATASTPVLRAHPEAAGHPLSSGQKRLWFVQQLDERNTSYNIVIALELHGPLNPAVLEATFGELIRRHKALRTRFVSVAGTPAASTAPDAHWRLERADLRCCEKSEKIDTLSNIVRTEARRPFQLDSGLLIRGLLLEFGHGDHVLILSVHHIVADGWSLGILFSELSQLYPALLKGQPSPLPPLPYEYADFVAWQNQLIASEKVQSQLRYWRAHLKPPLPVLELPADRPRPAQTTFCGARHHIRLSGKLVNRIREFGKSVQATDFMVLLAGLKATLYRYTGEEDLVVGSAVAGRSVPELECIVGLFINNLALRTSLGGNPTVRELIVRVKETCLNGFANQDLPFDTLVSELRPERNLNHSPVFQVMFILQNFPMPSRRIGDLTLRDLCINPGISRFDLTVEAHEDADDGLMLEVEYNTDVLAENTVRRFVRDYERILTSMTSDPDQHISALVSAGEEEVRELLAANARAQSDYPSELCIHHLFEQTVLRAPDKIAVTCDGRDIHYRELSRRSNQIANHLRALGVRRGSLVGVCVERSVEAVAALLGVLKAGAAYVPMDPHFPQERLAFMVEDTGMHVIVTDESSRSRTNLHVPAVLSLDDDRTAIDCTSAADPASEVSSEDLAYVIFTSGSTGRPKGVQITHRSVVNFLESMRREPGLTADDRLVSVTTFSFDIAGLEVFLPLIAGARTILASRAVSLDGPALSRLIEDSNATVMQATPATWRLLFESGWVGCNRLKVLCGGEAFPKELADRLVRTCAEVWNLYGPTETTIWSTVHKVTLADSAVPIGKPIANTRIYVLDNQQKPVPQGVPGELYIGGDGVARGYLNRPDLTEARFVADPYVPGERMYRTGDLVRYLSNGDLLFIGRNDHQVKIRGFRIELGEIENVLQRCAGVSDAVVIVREDVPGDLRIVAYAVPQPGATLAADELRSALLRQLPDYMMPSAFVIRPSFPLTPNRKIDRKALPPPDLSVSPDTFAPPTSNHESDVAAIWQDLLRLERVGIHDNFFDLGGHSLLLVQLQNRLRSHFGHEISILELFQRPTVSGMAAFFSGKSSGLRAQTALA